MSMIRGNNLIRTLFMILICVVACWEWNPKSAQAACNAPGGITFDGVKEVEIPDQVEPNWYTPNMNEIANIALNYFIFAQLQPVNKIIRKKKYYVCCPSVIPEPDPGITELTFHIVAGQEAASATINNNVLPSIFANLLQAAAAAGVSQNIVNELGNVLSSFSVTWSFSGGWDANYYDPEIHRDDCHNCSANSRWAGHENKDFDGKAGQYSNASWANGVGYLVEFTLIDASIHIHYSQAFQAGITYKLKTTTTMMISKRQFGDGPVQIYEFFPASVDTVVVDQHPFCAVTQPISP